MKKSAILLALLLGTSIVFSCISCSDSGNIEIDDDDDDEVYEEAVWSEFDDVKFIKLLKSYDGCDKVRYEDGWNKSKKLDEKDDLSEDASTCTYRIKTQDGDIYLFFHGA